MKKQNQNLVLKRIKEEAEWKLEDESWMKDCTNEYELFSNFFKRVIDSEYIFRLIEKANDKNNRCELHQTTKSFISLCNPPRIRAPNYSTENQNFVNVCSAATLKKRFDGYRYVEAKKSLQCGVVIASEEPTIIFSKPNCICVKNKYHHCHYCGKMLILFLPCGRCEICVYCNQLCLIKAWQNFHQWECDGMTGHFWSNNAYFAMRMLLIGILNNFKQEPENDECNFTRQSETYAFLSQLNSHRENMKNDELLEILKNAAQTLVYLIERTRFFRIVFSRKMFPNKTLYECYMEIGAKLFLHECQAITNVLSLGYFDFRVKNFNDSICYTKEALCLSLSMFNHSCEANAVIFAVENFVVMKALRKIKRGEEICINYYDVSNTFAQYSKRFTFLCRCKKCLNPLPVDLNNTYKCTKFKCKGKVHPPTFNCTKCNTHLDEQKIISNETAIVNYKKQFEKEKDYCHLNQAVRTFEMISHKSNIKLADCYMDIAMYLVDKRFAKSYCNLITALCIYEKFIPKYSLTLLYKKLEYVQAIVQSNKNAYTLTDPMELNMVMKTFVSVKKHLRFFHLYPKLLAVDFEIMKVDNQLKTIEDKKRKMQNKKDK